MKLLRSAPVLTVFIIIAAGLVTMTAHIASDMEAPLLLFLANTSCIFVPLTAVAYFAAIGYITGGSVRLLLIGCAALSFGVTSLTAGIFGLYGNVNAVVTVHNMGALAAALFMIGAYITGKRESAFNFILFRKDWFVAFAYFSVLLLASCLIFATVKELLPKFIIPGQGLTLIRLVVLGGAALVFGVKALLAIQTHIRKKADFTYWYSLGLSMISIGLFCVLLQTGVGTLLGWIGRISQYAGCIYLVIAVFCAQRLAKETAQPLGAVIDGLFKEEHQLLMKSIADAIIVFRASGEIVEWNQAAIRLFGYQPKEVIGLHTIREFLGGYFHELVSEGINGNLADNQQLALGQTRAIEVRKKDGVLLPCELTACVIIDASRKPLYYAIIRDVSERKDFEEKLQTLNLELEHRVEVRTQELASANEKLIDRNKKIIAGNEELTAQHEEITAMNAEISLLNAKLMEMNETLELRVEERTAELTAAHEELTSQYEELLQAEQKILRKAEMQSVLKKITDAGLLSLSLDELYQKVHNLVQQVLPAKNFNIAVVDQGAGQIFVPYSVDETGAVPRQRPLGKGLTEYVIRQGRAMHVTPAELEKMRAKGEFDLPFIPTIDYLGAPLFNSSGSVFGVISMFLIQEKDPFQAEDAEILSIIAAQVAMAIERKRAEDQLHKLNETLEQQIVDRTLQLEAANKELDGFNHSIAHDLRAPLRHITGFIGLLRSDVGDQFDEVSNEYLQIISDAATNMGQLIDHLLEFSQARKAEMCQYKLDTPQLVREVMDDFKPEMQGRHITWIISELPGVNGDSSMLRIVWSNLINNALKYTRFKEQATIEIGFIPDPQDNNFVAFFIKDNGAGFDMKYKDKLFGLFQRLHSNSEFEGNGVGLANVQRIIMRHGGRVWAEGQVNEGATFYFTLHKSA